MSTLNSKHGKLCLRNEWEIKTFSDKTKLRELVTNRPTLKECLKKSSGNKNKQKRLKLAFATNLTILKYYTCNM